jgi:hypothetical protein
MEPVIDMRPVARLGAPGVNGIADGPPRRLPRIVADRRDPAARRRASSGFEVVDTRHSTHLVLQVSVDIDATRQDQETGGVNFPRAPGQ